MADLFWVWVAVSVHSMMDGAGVGAHRSVLIISPFLTFQHAMDVGNHGMDGLNLRSDVATNIGCGSPRVSL